MSRIVAVIGAGITGVITAYRLLESGFKVIVFSSHQPHAATLNNPGGVNPLHGSLLSAGFGDIYRQAYESHLNLSSELGLALSGHGDWRRIHRLFLAFSHQDQVGIEMMSHLYGAIPGFEATLLDSEAIQRLDSRLPPAAAGGLLTYGNVSVVAADYCRAISSVVKTRGAHMISESVVSFSQSEGRIDRVYTQHDSYEVDAVVLAAGVWSQALLDTLCIYPGLLRPVKGEMLLIDLYDAHPIGFDVTYGLSGFYHHAADQYWLGGTRDDPTLHPGPTEAGRRQILDGIRAILPGLNFDASHVLQHCAGYRPSTLDDLPVVGPLLPFSNLIIASGGGSKGMLLAPWLAATAVAFITGPPPEVPPSMLPRRSLH